MSIEAFTLNGETVTLSVTTSSPTPTAFSPKNGSIRVYNSGSVTVFLRSGIGTSDATATTSHTPIAPGTVESFTVPANHTYVSGITSSGSATVYVQVGDGI
jgi:hypothetical protein